VSVTKEGGDIRPAAVFLRLALWSGAAVAAAFAVGSFPTYALAGSAGIAAMAWGLGIALLSSLAGLVPPVLMVREDPQRRLKGTLAGATIRFLVMLALLLGSLLSGVFSKVALAVWAGIGYIVLLAVDTAGAVWLNKRAARASS
jgi:hypothetical protein